MAHEPFHHDLRLDTLRRSMKSAPASLDRPKQAGREATHVHGRSPGPLVSQPIQGWTDESAGSGNLSVDPGRDTKASAEALRAPGLWHVRVPARTLLAAGRSTGTPCP